MPVAAPRNEEHYKLETSDLLDVENKNFIFEAYDSSSNSFTSTEVQPFNTVRLNTAPDIYDFASNILTIARAGVYLFNVRLAVAAGAGNAEAAFYLEEDPDTGVFATVTSALAYVNVIGTMRQTAQLMVPLRVGFDYRYRVSIIRTLGADTLTVVANSANFSALCLYQNR